MYGGDEAISIDFQYFLRIYSRGCDVFRDIARIMEK